MPKEKQRGNPKIIFRLPAADKRRVEGAAQYLGCSVSDFVRMAVQAAFVQMDIPEPKPEQLPGQTRIAECD